MKPGAKATELGHVHLFVRSLARSVDFYAQIIGLRETERLGQSIAFLTSSGRHHTLALQALGESAGPQAPGRVGLYHVAFELPDAAALDAALERLDGAGIAWQAVDHGISWAVYFADPDGNGLELYVDRRRHSGGRRRWGGITAPLTRRAIRRAVGQEITSGRSGGSRSGALGSAHAPDQPTTSETSQGE